MNRLLKSRTGVFFLAAIWSCSVCLGMTWFEPDFETLVDQAKLIAVVEITADDAYSSKAKVIEMLKGERPIGDIEISGFNNPNLPESGIRLESFLTGQRLLMFFCQFESDRKGVGEANSKWFVPSGDFRIVNDKIRGGWLEVSHPYSKPAVDAKMVTELVRGYVLHKAGAAPVAARELLRNQLTVSNVVSVQKGMGQSVEDKAWLLQWLLCAQAAYGESGNSKAVLEATRSANYVVKLCGARALPSLGSIPEVFEAAKSLITDTNSFVQAEACRVLAEGSFGAQRVAPILLSALEKSDPRGSGPRSIMDPLQNKASGRETIIRALAETGGGPAIEAALVKLIPSVAVKEKIEPLLPDDVVEERWFLNDGVFNALSAYFLKFPSASARKAFIELYPKVWELHAETFEEYLLKDRSREGADAIIDRLRTSQKLPLGTHQKLVRLATRLPDRDSRLEGLVFDLLKKYDGRGEARDVMSAAIAAASPRIEELLRTYRTETLVKDDSGEINWEESWRQTLRLTKEGVTNKLHQQRPEKRLTTWVELLKKDARLGFTKDFVLNEIVRSTPAELRPKAVEAIRTVGERPEYFRAMRALGGVLSAKELEESEWKEFGWAPY